MVWNQREIEAHKGVEEENPRMFLDYKLPDRSRDYEYNLNY